MSAEPSLPDTSASGPTGPAKEPVRRDVLVTIAVWVASLAVACCLGLAVAGGTQVARSRTPDLGINLPAVVGLAAGILVGLIQWHPRRALGLIPYGAVVIALGQGGLALHWDPGWCVAVIAFGAALAGLPLRFLIPGPAQLLIVGLFLAALCSGCFGKEEADRHGWPSLDWRLLDWRHLTTAGVGAVLAFWLLYREWLEQTLEVLLWPIHRIRGFGPGLRSFPRRGPVLVVSNHTAWLDPLWLGKVIPRRIIPMMTSLFYDLPVMRFLMVYVVGAIRVQDSGFRRDVPELDEAVAALDRGECVVIFPEGRVRRKEEEVLRQFGRGVWHILQRRPQTPVVVCWIEGGWGSFFSYYRGVPMKNKPFDRWRRIHIGLSAPQVLEAAVLADHRETRSFLRRACLEARRFLGLEPHAFAAPSEKEQDEEVEGPGGEQP